MPIVGGLGGTSYSDHVLADGNTYYYDLGDGYDPPTIDQISADVVRDGDVLTISGTEFDPVTSNNHVLFDGFEGTVLSVSPVGLSVQAPSKVRSGYTFVVGRTGVSNVISIEGDVNKSGTLDSINSVAAFSDGTVFAACGATPTAVNKVYKINLDGTVTQVGALNTAVGLPTDEVSSPARIYYGNGVTNTNNFGTIRYTTSAGGEALWNLAGCLSTSDAVYVNGVGYDPTYGGAGMPRLYVADRRLGRVLVPPFGTGGCTLDTLISGGLDFSQIPAGITVDNNTGGLYQHDFITSEINRLTMWTPAAATVKTWTSSNSPVSSPAQVAVTPYSNPTANSHERVVSVNRDVKNVFVIDPKTDKSRVLDISPSRFTSPPVAVASEKTAGGLINLYIGFGTHVLRKQLGKAVYISLWRADDADISDTAIWGMVNDAQANWAGAGIDVVVRNNVINSFVSPFKANPNGAMSTQEDRASGCPTLCPPSPCDQLSPDEATLLGNAARRSAVNTDLNVYFVKEIDWCPFAGGGEIPRILAETLTEDHFLDVTDLTNSGIIMSAHLIKLYTRRARIPIPILTHEIGHALIDRASWGGDEHKVGGTGVDFTEPDIMTPDIGFDLRIYLIDGNQFANVNQDVSKFIVYP